MPEKLETSGKKRRLWKVLGNQFIPCNHDSQYTLNLSAMTQVVSAHNRSRSE